MTAFNLLKKLKYYLKKILQTAVFDKEHKKLGALTLGDGCPFGDVPGRGTGSPLQNSNAKA